MARPGLRSDDAPALDRLSVLVMDCQATGANPHRGSIIEIGWLRLDGLADDVRRRPIETRILKLPPAHELPARVQRVTGIGPEDIAAGLDPCAAWQEIVAVAQAVARQNRMAKCPAVVHFARFEAPFLHDLHARVLPGAGFPLELICTHEISRRLFPYLPRRSIRAISGYCGWPVADLRRAGEHVAATAAIWRATAGLLRERHAILTLGELTQWLAQPYKSAAAPRVYPMPASALADLPAKPGVYRMLGAAGDILYIGKAASLRPRVKSYFRKGSRHAEHIMEMLSQARRIDITVAGSALEAAIREADEIKQHDPPCNRALRRSGRSVWFASRDFSSFSDRPRASNPIGPLARTDAVAAAGAIRHLVQTGCLPAPDEGSALAGLGLPDGQAPDPRCIMAGYGLFYDRYGKRSRTVTPHRFIFELGRELWTRALVEEVADTDGPVDLELKSITVRSWTPDAVCEIIGSNIARAAHEMRLARWFALLCESALGWEEHVGKDRQRFVIVLHHGQVRYRRDKAAMTLSVPPGYRAALRTRQRAFDLATLDRLRVLTTEMRKLVQRGHRVKLRFGPGHTVDHEALKRIFTAI